MKTLPLTHTGPEQPAAFLVLSAEAKARREAEALAARGPGFTRAEARRFALKFYLFLAGTLAVAGLWRIL